MSERTPYNALAISALSGTTQVTGAGLEAAEGLSFSTIYPAGLFAACTFYVPRDVTASWTLKAGHKLIVRNGMKTVWEGRVTAIGVDVDGVREGNNVTALGYWADVLMARGIRKPWADTRISDDPWQWLTTSPAAEKCTLDRNNRLRFTPKAEAHADTENAAVQYTAPTGQTIKRIAFNYDLQEAGQAWTLGLNTSHEGLWSVTSSGTGTQNITLGTARQVVYFYFQANAAQTPPSDGTIYGQISNLQLFTETGDITLPEIAKDIRALVTELSASETLIGANTLSLVPFVIDGQSYADALILAASYGDSSYQSWAVGVRESDLSTDSKPILFAEAYPALTDYDYAVRLDEPNLIPPFKAEQDIEPVRNWIAVRYRDESGRTVYLTPDDDADLKDATSIAAYGERQEWISVDTTSITTAETFGRRYLAARKDPQWRISTGLTVTGFIRAKSGAIVPASEIRAGKRVKVENYLNDLSGTGLTLRITGTSYDDTTETNTMDVGLPDNLDVLLARQSMGLSITGA